MKLRSSRVLQIGVGGLGSVTALYLAAAGIGHITLLDADIVDRTNLQRQVLYTENDCGKPKATIAAHRLRAINNDITIEALPQWLDSTNSEALIASHDIIVDGCDNYATRCLLNSVCHQLHKPYVYGAIEGFEGQVSVFEPTANSIRYSQLYPNAPSHPSKAVIGMTAAIVGSVQAHEVVKLICGYGEPLKSRLWTVNLQNMQTHIIDL